MPVWGALAATLGWNYSRHLRHKSTLCSATRRVMPNKWVAVPVLVIGFDALLTHYVNGYIDALVVDLENL